MAPEIESQAFLALSIAGLALTANAFRPLRGRLRIPAFFASWLVNELPLHTIVGQAGVTILFSRRGAFTSWPGWIGLLCTLTSWALVVLLAWRGHRAGAAMASALGSHGGDDPWPRVPSHKLVFPFAPWRSGVRVTRNVVFTGGEKPALHLDVFQPPGPGARRPAILQIHGGGWVIGDKREQGLPLLHHLAANGWVGFNANYRLSPRATFPDHLIDVKRAIAWIREHAAEYGVDPGFLCITGGSAGGHLSALAALTANDPAYQPGFEDRDTRVQGAVCFYGVYCFTDRLGVSPRGFVSLLLERLVMKARLRDVPEAFRLASPLDRIHAEAPPILVVHGDGDTLAPVEYARHFAEELRKVSRAPVLYAEIPGAQHAFDVFFSPRTSRVVEGVERFLAATHRGAGAGAGTVRG